MNSPHDDDDMVQIVAPKTYKNTILNLNSTNIIKKEDLKAKQQARQKTNNYKLLSKAGKH